MSDLNGLEEAGIVFIAILILGTITLAIIGLESLFYGGC